MDRRPPDDGSPGRIIATMVGIVGILLLGSLFWSALGALWTAFGQAGSSLPVARGPAVVLTVTGVPAQQGAPTPQGTAPTQPGAPTQGPAPTPQGAATPGPQPTPQGTPTTGPQPTVQQAAPTPQGTPPPAPQPTPQGAPTPGPSPTQAPAGTPTPQASGRNPWVLLPQPAPGSKVQAGSIVLEARARGDAPITEIRLELDGTALPASVEQRGENTWRGTAATRIAPGAHSARAVVVDATGRSGAYRWTFEAAP